jgi:EAL domain-containing protein (putative c-di-GMP-specific phosphodiesterase class I)
MRKVVMPVFQPIVDIATGTISHHEALARAHEGSPGHVKLIEVGEAYGFVDLIDIAVVEHVFAFLRRHPTARIAVNISVVTIERSCSDLLALVFQNMELAARMIFEITETVAIHDMAQVLRFVAAVRLLDAKIAIDDFGTGHFTIQLVEILKPEYLKLSCNLVDDLAKTGSEIAALRQITQRYGGVIIAEHVDSAEKLVALRELKVEYAQGFYLGRPVGIEAAFGTKLRTDIAQKVMASRQFGLQDHRVARTEAGLLARS